MRGGCILNSIGFDPLGAVRRCQVEVGNPSSQNRRRGLIAGRWYQDTSRVALTCLRLPDVQIREEKRLMYFLFGLGFGRRGPALHLNKVQGRRQPGDWWPAGAPGTAVSCNRNH